MFDGNRNGMFMCVNMYGRYFNLYFSVNENK